MLEQERQQYELLKEEKIDLEREFSERLSKMEVGGRTLFVASSCSCFLLPASSFFLLS